MGARSRAIRQLQISPWRVRDGLRVAADAGGLHDLATFLARGWRDLVPVVEDMLEAEGFHIGVTACGRGHLSRRERYNIRPDTSTLLPLDKYKKVIIGMSGGKDSVAGALLLIQRCIDDGIDPADKIEFWHHLVDGEPDRLVATPDQKGAVYIGDRPLTRLQEHHIRLMRETLQVKAEAKRAAAALRPITAELAELWDRRRRELAEHEAGRRRKADVLTKAAIGRRRKELGAREQELALQRLETRLKHLTGKLWQLHLDLDSEADVTPMLVTDAELNAWKRARRRPGSGVSISASTAEGTRAAAGAAS